MNSQQIREAMPACDGWRVRQVEQQDEEISIDRGVLQAPSLDLQRGVMVTIRHGVGEGYAATADLTPSGLSAAAARAKMWAEHAAAHPLLASRTARPVPPSAPFITAAAIPWESVPLQDKIARLQKATAVLHDAGLPNWIGELANRDVKTSITTSDGTELSSHTRVLMPTILLLGESKHGGTVRRSLGRSNNAQGGLEFLDTLGFDTAAERLLAEVRELGQAEQCPSGVMDVVFAADHMMIQIHESIGHPLELDRILGDERNFAGTTFVTPEMVGTFQYGSELLNVTFDPTYQGEIASYGFDDTGTPATREFLIRNGKLERVLGGALSQERAGLPGVACERSSNWRRAPIDRMANLNIEPGNMRFEELIGAVEDGVYMTTNRSWSIDDSRNKFQFSAEFGRRIRNGKLAEVVQQPGYRGESRAFWRSLAGVGDASTFEAHGTPYCGKGEPNQVVTVGHATPACWFKNVEVFGGN